MHYYTDPGGNAIERAFKKSGELMQAENSLEISLVVPQLSNLQGIISDVIGEDVVKLLTKHKEFVLNPQKIKLYTKRHPPRYLKGPLLVAFTPYKQLQSVVLSNPGASIIYVPWTIAEKDSFVCEYSPTLI